ncbi:MAG TPA: hypothetical protein VMT86_04060 [Bryobacteraceae bacterium]|nr:hypothetical protein [Bryobacteraceae bacterium]
MDQDRRQFLRQCVLAAGGVIALEAQTPKRILIRPAPGTSFRSRLAGRELLRGLAGLFPAVEVRLSDSPASNGDVAIALRVDNSGLGNPEAYEIRNDGSQIVLRGAGEQSLLYAVFEFLERQGAFFGIDGVSYPIDPASRVLLPAVGQPWRASPRFATRGLLPWPDFLNCITVYNEEDFRAYFESMLRMRFNTFGMHVYTGANQWAESYLSFEYAGAGHLSFLDNSASNRWGYLPERTSRFTMGGAQFFDAEVFGSDATRLARDPWEQAERARALLRAGFDHAARLGIKTGIGFEPYQIPDEILRALPPEVRLDKSSGPRFDVESRTAKDMLEVRLAQLLEAYPQVDYVWLWEDEDMNWESRKTGVPLSVTPFREAYDFLRRNAPHKRLVLAGWGGVARHFEHFHRNLPGDIIFSCLNDSLGWDLVDESFGKLENRERWPIPWLEDDPSMWFPQFRASRFELDMNRAVQFGCQGLLGIHWRHRIVDPTAGFQARFSWEPDLKLSDYYAAYAGTQAGGDRAKKLAAILADADQTRKLMSTNPGEVSGGHAVQHEFSGDYGEAFMYWEPYHPLDRVVSSQKQVAARLRAITDQAAGPNERERLEYLTRHVEFLIPYAEAFDLAHSMDRILKDSAEMKKAGHIDEAADTVRDECVPLWLKLAPCVRRVMLDYQGIIATRNDLGQLASMHNKLVRLALIRLRLSMREYLGELPAEVEQMYTQSIAPDEKMAARVFLPTRPTLFTGEDTVRLTIVVPGMEGVRSVTVRTRPRGGEWSSKPAELVQRRTYQTTLGPFPGATEYVDYLAEAALVGRDQPIATQAVSATLL